MAKDLDKLKKALREGEYSSVRASSQNQSQSTDYENDSEHLGSEVRVAIEEKPKKNASILYHPFMHSLRLDYSSMAIQKFRSEH